MDVVLEKPWRDLRAYVESRKAEAKAELKLALILAREGYLRNAAGKLFQAFKSYVAALAGERRHELKTRWRDVDKIIAYMPTRVLKEVASALGLKKEGYVALALHQFQYNGPDPEGVMSIYPDKKAALRDFCWLAKRIADLLNAAEEAAYLGELCKE
ncbi:MAG: PaREP1 family protein [Pyrobaculum sp.]